MADEFDFFALTGLAFDPLETDAIKVDAAIQGKLRELGQSQGITHGLAESAQLRATIKYLDDRSREVLDGKKVTKVYRELGAAKTTEVMKRLGDVVALQAQAGAKTVTPWQIRQYHETFGLTTANVTKAFKDAGIEVAQFDLKKSLPKFPTNASKTWEDLSALRKLKDQRAGTPDLATIADLYGLAAYLEGDSEPDKMTGAYKAMSAAELVSLFDRHSKVYSERNDTLGHYCAELISAAKTWVFNTEDNRRAYDAYLRYRTLDGLFAQLKATDKAALQNPALAEPLIDRIAAIFPEEGAALAIYNEESGLRLAGDPYLPIEAACYVKCPRCQALCKFGDQAEAQKRNACTNCKRPLYKPCPNPKCGKLILDDPDIGRCPECGFVFASTAMFVKNFTAAEQAFRTSDFDTARALLAQAQAADPTQQPKCEQLASRIDAEEKRYQKPITDVRALIADRKYQAAGRALAKIAGEFPGLNASALDAQVKTALRQAQAAFDAAKRLPEQKRADEALAVLQACVDFQPAIDLLASTPPSPPDHLTPSLDTLAACVTLQWPRSPEQAVTYRLVRKDGKAAPVSDKDGTVLANDVSETSYRDTSVQPGADVTYAVFALRRGVASSPASATIILRAEVRNVHVTQTGRALHLSWDTPKGCTGVTISRSEGGARTVLTRNAQSSWDDEAVQFGVAYTYQLCANYPSQQPSRGVEVTTTPTVQIDEFTISGTPGKGTTYEVSWSFPQPGIDVRVMVDGKQAGQASSGAGSCVVELPPNGIRQVSASALSGGAWLASANTLSVNTYAPCTIDKAVSVPEEAAIPGAPNNMRKIIHHLRVAQPIPSGVAGFRYAIRTAPGSGHWASAGDPDLRWVDIGAYRQHGEIRVSDTARDEAAYYVTLFTVFDAGSREVMSDADRCRIGRPLKVDIYWSVRRGFRGPLTLALDLRANRPMDRVPRLWLCGGDGWQVLYSQNDPRAQPLAEISPVELEPARTQYQAVYTIETNIAPRQVKDMLLHLFPETQADSNETFAPRWTDGFTGRI